MMSSVHIAATAVLLIDALCGLRPVIAEDTAAHLKKAAQLRPEAEITQTWTPGSKPIVPIFVPLESLAAETQEKLPPTALKDVATHDRLGQDTQNGQAEVAQGLASLMSAPPGRRELLTFQGNVAGNVFPLSDLDTALDIVDAEPVASQDILRVFEHVRDKQFFQNSTTGRFDPVFRNSIAPCTRQCDKKWLLAGEFWRRLPWDYSRDGCFMRAEFMAQWAGDVIDVNPRNVHKVFIFHKPEMPWHYHVALLLRADDANWTYYVVDPMFSFEKVYTLTEWILTNVHAFNASVKTLEEATMITGIAIANRFVFSPDDPADVRASVVMDRKAMVRTLPVPDPRNDSPSLIDLAEKYLYEEWKALKKEHENVVAYLRQQMPKAHF